MVDEENVVRLSDSLCGICHTTNMAQGNPHPLDSRWWSCAGPQAL